MIQPSSGQESDLTPSLSPPLRTLFSHRGLKAALNVLLVLVACTTGFIIVEGLLRARHDISFLSFENFYERNRDLFGSAYPAVYDPALGWIPRAGFTSNNNVWKTEVTILTDGTRSNGPELRVPPGARPILAVGDSFTFGDEVSDEETWPAQLEVQTGRRVVNAGVFGYGLDQTILRAEQLVSVEHPDVIIVSFIADDILRLGLSERTNVGKPYFVIEDRQLVLRNSPVPRKREEWSTMVLLKPLGYSYLVHVLMMRLAPNIWLGGEGFWTERQGAGSTDPEAVACLLMVRLQNLATAKAVKVILLAQREKHASPEKDGIVARVVACADPAIIQVLDLTHELSELENTDPQGYSLLYGYGHMNQTGNAWVVKRTAGYLGAD